MGRGTKIDGRWEDLRLRFTAADANLVHRVLREIFFELGFYLL